MSVASTSLLGLGLPSLSQLSPSSSQLSVTRSPSCSRLRSPSEDSRQVSCTSFIQSGKFSSRLSAEFAEGSSEEARLAAQREARRRSLRAADDETDATKDRPPRRLRSRRVRDPAAATCAAPGVATLSASDAGPDAGQAAGHAAGQAAEAGAGGGAGEVAGQDAGQDGQAAPGQEPWWSLKF